ncbi:MAG: hypothetical protein RLZZ78_1324 [Armatimonadota bacterium]
MKPSRLNYLGNEKPPRPEKKTQASPARRQVPAQPMVSSNGVPVPESFQIDIAEVLRTIGMHYVHQIAIPAIGCFDPETGDVPVSGKVEGKISLTNSGAILILRGKATANVWLPCARCLRSYEERLAVVLEEEYDLVADNTATRHEDVVAVDQNVTAPVIEGTVLDVAELLRQSLILAEPLQPFCGDTCEGHATYSTEPEAEALPSDTQRPFAGLAALLEANSSAE